MLVNGGGLLTFTPFLNQTRAMKDTLLLALTHSTSSGNEKYGMIPLHASKLWQGVSLLVVNIH